MVDRILGFLFGVLRGFILIVIPYMFYEAFFPQTDQHYPWVREAKSLPYIKGTGDSIPASSRQSRRPGSSRDA